MSEGAFGFLIGIGLGLSVFFALDAFDAATPEPPRVEAVFLDGRHEQVKCYFNTATGATLFCEGMGQ